MATRFLAPGDPGADLSAQRRDRDLQEIADGPPLDVVVIGGGITGVGTALDAATRGLRVALFEAEDLAFGTSRWSSKLVHGGLRYLATGDVATAWESAVERGILMRTTAPFLVRPAAQVVPIMDDTTLPSAALTRIGFAAGDTLRLGARTRRHTLPPARTLTKQRVCTLLPAIDAPRVRGGLLSWDGSLEDDARLVIAVARTAAAYGAHILTRMQVQAADGHGVQVVDQQSGQLLNIAARAVVNATGVWSESFDPALRIVASRGTHVVLPASLLGHPRAALTVPVPGMSNRYCFLLPRPDGLVLAGITDIPEMGPIPAVPKTPQEDIDWILSQVSSVLERPLTAQDAVGAFTGLRPLVQPARDSSPTSSADISRRHLVRQAASGVWTVTGGKLTTYRRMAQDVIDKVTDRPCVTRNTALIGTGPLAGAMNLPARLLRRYGNEAPRVAALAEGNPHLLDPIAPGLGARGVELIFGRCTEGAQTVEDLIERRTRVSLVTAHVELAQPIAAQVLDDYQ